MNQEQHFFQDIQFKDKSISSMSPVYIIAEIGVNFNGSLELAKQSIDEAANAGANAAKFQTFKTEEFISDKELTYTYTNKDGDEVTETQFEMFKRLELPDEWHSELCEYAKSKNIHFLSSVADNNAVDLLCSLDIPALKIASADLIHTTLLEYVATKDIPVILSTGMGDIDEIQEAINIFKKNNHRKIILLHCTSSYPTPADACNLKRIQTLAQKFQVPVGFSDHTEGIEAATIATALGSCIIEKHFTVDRSLPGPDHTMSMDPLDFKKMVDQIRLTETLLGSSKLTYDPIEEEARIDFRASIVAAEDIPKGTQLSHSHLSYKRPGSGLKPSLKSKLLGKTLNKDIQKNQQFTLDDVS